MALYDTVSFCGLDTTVRIEDDNDEESAIKLRRKYSSLLQMYPLDIQFYTRIPYPISTEKMKALIKERIFVLKEIHLAMKNSDYSTVQEKRKILTAKLGMIRAHRYAKLINSEGCRTYLPEELDDRIADHASFVALRLSLASRDEEHALHQRIEEELFHIRVSALNNNGIHELLSFNEIQYEKISDDEKIAFKDELSELLHNPHDFDNTEFFKIPIITLLGFINVYDIFLKDGIAFVPLEQMRAVLRAHYHNYLEYEAAAINIDNFETACRYADGTDKFYDLFDYCCREFQTMQQKIMKESNISIPMIDMLAKTAFPPCMRVIHEFLREHHHLKHESRLQYILFLKGIGLKVQDTTTLFRNEFTQVVTSERFEKEYTYYIYHAYGMRGRKYDTPPKDCSLIINSITQFGDCNGCIFANNRVADMEDLGRKLTGWNISEEHIEEITEHTKHGQCGYACATYFHAINNYLLTGPVTHPNKFFNESRRISNLPEGCISDESEASDNEIDVDDVCPDIQVDVDDKSMSTDVFDNSYLELVQMVIDWETQTCTKNIKAGSIVKLKRKT